MSDATRAKPISPIPKGAALRPRVALPISGIPAPFVVGGIILMGILLFFYLETLRHHRTAPRQLPSGESAPVMAEPPPLVIPPPPPPPPPLPPKPSPSAPAPPTVVYVDRPGPAPPPIIKYVERPGPPTPPPIPGGGADPAVLVDLGGPVGAGPGAEEVAVRANLLRGPATLVPQGTVIPAVLETPIDSSRIGPARALTTSDTHGFDGARVLIPKGSRLIGEVSGDVQSGQSRVLVTWTRLIRPDGAAIRIASPASDSLGGAGISGHVNNHTLARLTNAVLQTAFVVGAELGTELATRPASGGVIVQLPGQAATTVGQVLIPNSDVIRPTITVKAGARITVFVARDLDFSGVQLRSPP